MPNSFKSVQSQVAEAALAAGRTPESVAIVAVSKYVDAQSTWELVQSGAGHLGESRPQSLWEKYGFISDKLAELAESAGSTVQASQQSGLQWHMIGHLQRNKAARTVPLIEWLHSLDSLRLAETVSAESLKLHKRLKVLLEVNVTTDATKTGMPAAEAAQTLEQFLALPGLEVRGLMAMSTEGASSVQARREFESVRELRDRLQQQYADHCQLDQLSMGMSGDFAQAIAAGATMVRLGSILWDS